MIATFTDEWVRSVAVDYWKGDLPDVQMHQVEQHLEANPQTAEFYARMQRTLDAAADLPVEAWVESNAGAIAARLKARIAAEGHDRKPRIWERFKVALLATDLRLRFALIATTAVAVGAGLVLWVPRPMVTRTQPVLTAESPTIQRPMRWALEAEDESHEDVKIVASTDADYTARFAKNDHDDHRLEVRSGIVVVEYVPLEHRLLSVLTPDAEIEVTGTIFYVDVRDGLTDVGVLKGEVKVHRQHAAVVTLRSRSRLEPNASAASLVEQEAVAAIAEHIDIADHDRKLQTRRAKPESLPPAPKTTGTGSKQPVTPIRTLAERAVQAGNYATAAALLEDGLRTGAWPRDQEAYARLELARLYLLQLRSPRKAVPHLEHFLRQWPEHQMASYARTKLCEITQGDSCETHSH